MVRRVRVEMKGIEARRGQGRSVKCSRATRSGGTTGMGQGDRTDRTDRIRRRWWRSAGGHRRAGGRCGVVGASTSSQALKAQGRDCPPRRVQANDASLLPRPRGPPAAFDWVAGTGGTRAGALRQEHQNRAGSSTTDVTSRSWELRAPHAPFRPNPPTQRPQTSPTCARCIPFPSVLPALERALRQTLPPRSLPWAHHPPSYLCRLVPASVALAAHPRTVKTTPPARTHNNTPTRPPRPAAPQQTNGPFAMRPDCI